MLILIKVGKPFTIHEKATILRDAVFAANDGIVTTFAVVAGSAGASLSSKVIIVLGFANLLADGISMASGNYLGVKSEMDYQKEKDNKFVPDHSPLRHGIVTFVSFVLIGFFPLMPYVFGFETGFAMSIATVALTLFLVGSARSVFTKKSWFVGGVEMLFVGGIAAFTAYLVGFFLGQTVL